MYVRERSIPRSTESLPRFHELMMEVWIEGKGNGGGKKREVWTKGSLGSKSKSRKLELETKVKGKFGHCQKGGL